MYLFFFNDTATTEIYTLSLHDALPIWQHLTRDWPVLDLGLTPQISRERWRLDVYGAVEQPIFWDFAQFTAQPQTGFTSDIHCVTTRSRDDNQWEGRATRDLLDACRRAD